MQTASLTVTVRSVPGLVVSMPTPPDIVIGVPYSYQLQPSVSGGTPPYSAPVYAVVNALPPGIVLSPTGLLSGTANGLPTGGKVSVTYTDSGN